MVCDKKKRFVYIIHAGFHLLQLPKGKGLEIYVEWYNPWLKNDI